MSNPYGLYGSVATGDRFVGRLTELDRLRDVLFSNGGSRALIGEPKIGKSSLADVIFVEAGDLPSLSAHWIDVSACSPTDSLFDSILAALGEQFEFDDPSAGNEAHPIVKDFLLQRARDGERTLIVLDEFDAVESTLGPSLGIRRLREIVSNPRRYGLSVLIIARSKLATIEKQIMNLSTLDHVCPSVFVRPFGRAETVAMAQRAWDEESATTVATAVHSLTGGHPFLSEMVFYHLQNDVSLSDIRDATRAETLSYFERLTRLLVSDGLIDAVVTLARGGTLDPGITIETLVQYGLCTKSSRGDAVLWSELYAEYILGVYSHHPVTWSTD